MTETKNKKVTVQVKKEVEKKGTSWSDAGLLMKKAGNEKDLQTQRMIIALSVAFDIPPQGITILADNPYINKQGLEFVFDKYKNSKGWGYFLSTPVNLSKSAGDTAVFETSLFNKSGAKIANGYGSANASNIKMGTIKVFLNEMAETRSQNRCLRKVISPILYRTFIERVRSVSVEDRALIADASAKFGSVTAEEIGNVGSEQTPAETLLTEEEMKGIADFLQRIINAESSEKLKEIGSLIKAGKDVGKFNENQVKTLKEAWVKKAENLAFNNK
jgi:hypothetical protein